MKTHNARLSIRRLGWMACVLASSWAMPAWAQTVIVDQGKPTATIVLSAQATKNETLAAQELQAHVKLITGATLNIVKQPAAAEGIAIYIGQAAGDEGKARIASHSKDPFALRVEVTPKEVRLQGNSDDGTFSAVYELLHQAGVRWFMLGPYGVDVIESPTLTLKEQDFIDAPRLRGRILQAIGDRDWARRHRLGGFTAGGHGLGPKFDREKEPHLFYHENGKPTHQEKISEPEVLQRVIAHWREKLKQNPDLEYISVGPHDGAGFASDPWDADDFDPIIGLTATTDRFIKFFNLILEDLQKDYPNVGNAFYAYTRELRPPVREKPNPKILPMIAAIGLDRFHSINNPLSWEKKYLRTVIEGWQALGVNLMYRGYLFNLADHGLPFSMIDIVREEWPYYYSKGFIAMRVECIPNWAYHGPSLYLAARLMWNPQLDSDAILNEYWERFYGPAAPAMKKHFDIIENAYINCDYYTGNVFDVPKILTPEIRKHMEETLIAAEQAVKGKEVYEQRVRTVRLGFDYGQANFVMMDAYNRCDFALARKAHDQIVNEIIPACLAHKPAVITPRAHVGYFKRFWGRSVIHASERIENGREIATILPDEWLSFLDPYNAGDKLFLQDPQLGTQSWQPIRTWSDSTSNQGLRYYKDTIWYRTNLTVPEKYAGRKLRVWMGGIDDTVRVWIDGQELEVMQKGSAPIGMPWEFDAGSTITPGKQQVIVLKVSDNSMNELGTMGITGPIMIWAEP
jgi:hypothetical protein